MSGFLAQRYMNYKYNVYIYYYVGSVLALTNKLFIQILFILRRHLYICIPQESRDDGPSGLKHDVN
jgi:hypothetical protein